MAEEKEKLKIPYKMGIGPEGIMTEEQFKEMQTKKAKGDYTDINGNKMDGPVMTLTPEQFANLDKMQKQMKLKQQHEKRMEKLDKAKKTKQKKLESVRASMLKRQTEKQRPKSIIPKIELNKIVTPPNTPTTPTTPCEPSK